MDPKIKKFIIWWLHIACILTLVMVIVGGITRLTHSGLSMVEWKPLMGVIPPMTDNSWTETFEKYKQSPEFKIQNPNMTLSGFKGIFFWEYLHRLLGRVIGLVFMIPFTVLLIKKALHPDMIKKLLLMFILGGLQGFMGWFMVKSGLVDMPHVSHYRLAAHLLFAFGLMGYIFWVNLGLIYEDNPFKEKFPRLRQISIWITVVIIIQITWGAFTAGLKAGIGWNTFPTMSGQLIPEGLWSLIPWWANFFESNLTVQFTHRLIGWLLLVIISGFWYYSKQYDLGSMQSKSIQFLIGIMCVQFLLGVFTLIFLVPISLAVLHQVGASILFLSSIYTTYTLSGECQ